MGTFAQLIDVSPSVSGTRPVMLVSSGGGHFTELALIADRRRIPPEERHWVVPRTAQTSTALRGASVSWMPRVESRQVGAALRNLPAAVALHRRVRPRLVISTGAAQAVPHLLAAVAHHTPVEYDESVARIDGPSATGRIAARLPGAALVAPTGGWGGRWIHEPDLFTGFEVGPEVPRSGDGVLVSLGTEHYPFPRVVEQVRAVVDDGITWQVGHTDAVVGGEQLNRWLRPDDLFARMASCTVPIVHGGAGSVLTALSCGRVPVVIARSPELAEHVDDHQLRMCAQLADRGVIVWVRPDETLSERHLERAASMTARRRWSAATDVVRSAADPASP